MDRRYLLDTNVVSNYFFERREIDRRVENIMEDYNSLLFVSMISVAEMIHLVDCGRVRRIWRNTTDILPAMAEGNITLLPLKEEHLKVYAELRPTAGHSDPFDHLIIAQAIAERMTLISSDHKFFEYTKQRLTFIFNER